MHIYEVSYFDAESASVLMCFLRISTPGGDYRDAPRVMLRFLASTLTRPRVSIVVVALCIATESKLVNTLRPSSRAVSGMNPTKIACESYGKVN
jgi:hypothetical protein